MISYLKRWLGLGLLRALRPRVVYGLRCASGAWRPHSRMGTHTNVEHADKLRLGDHVYIGHFNFIDASGGLDIGEGCQVTNHVSILTHSSHIALRLERQAYWGNANPAGMQRAATQLGPWCFIGPHSVLAPGTRLGRGVLVKAYAHVRGEVPDYAIVEGQPARVVGDTRALDRAWLSQHGPALGSEAHAALAAAYEAWAHE